MTAVREMSRRDVLVVGAGPVGLVAACELARHGAPVRLIDRMAEPNLLPRAAGVQPRTQEMLSALGVIGRLGALGRQVPCVRVRDTEGAVLARVDLRGLPTRFPYLLAVDQANTEAVLRKRVAELGVLIEWGTELADLSQDGAGCDATLSSGGGEQQLRVGFVVGADGADSTVRNLVGAAVADAGSGEHFLVADAEADTDPSGHDRSPGSTDGCGVEMMVVAGRDGLAAAFPMAADRTRLLFAVPAPPSGAAPTVEQVRALCDERFGGQVRLGQPQWLTYFSARHGQVPRYRFGRVFLAGDAAHQHSPAGGPGMNTGMQDAFNLAWKLALVARGRAHPSLLDSYEAERHPVAARMVREATRLAGLTAAPAPGGEALRRLALFAAGHVAPADRAWASDLSELAVRYPDSPAVGHGTRGHAWSGVQPGEYAPAVPGLLDRPGHTVLLASRDDSAAVAMRNALGNLGAVRSIVDLQESGAGYAGVDGDDVVRRYGMGADGFVAIRPDGYVGFVSSEVTPAALLTYLHDHLRAI